MKAILGMLVLLSLLALTNACNRDATKTDENVQREEAIRSDDLREKDSFDRNVPLKDNKMDKETEEIDMGTQETSVTD
jgi:hypothetical protein